MSSTQLIRWSGLALLLAGLLIALPVPFHPDNADPEAVIRAAWVPVHSLIELGAILSLFGLVGLSIRYMEHLGWLGLMGFTLLFIGSGFFVGYVFVEAFVLPGIAVSPGRQVVLDPAGPLVAFWPPIPHLVGILGGVLLGLSYIWLGYALWAKAGERVPRANVSL